MSSRPHILYLVTSSAWGGAERYVSKLAAEASRAFDVVVAAGRSSDGRLFASLPEGVGRATIPHLKHRVAPLADLLAVMETKRLIDAEGIDLVHCNSSKAGLIGALAAACAKRKPKIIYTAHGWGFLESRFPLFSLLVLWSEKLASRFRDGTIVLSEMERGVALKRGLSAPERLHVIPHGIDAGEIGLLSRDDARRELGRITGIAPAAFVVGTIANAYPPKALPLLVEAFSRARLGSADLIVIGDGPEMPKVHAAKDASEAKERIHLPGAIAGAARYLSGFDVFVLASLKEGLPWAILEASAAGLPIVATRVGAIPELMHDGQDGLLVPPGDVGALAAAIKRLHEDRALREKLAAASSAIAASHPVSKMLASTMALYRSLLPKKD